MLTEAPVTLAPTHETRRRPPDKLRPIGIAAAVVVLQALLVAFFAWPALKLAPRDLPIVVAGPPAAVQQVQGRLDQLKPGGFKVSGTTDADQALRDRDAYAAFIPAPDGSMAVHVASAASPTVAALLTQQFAGSQVKVVDVVPVAADDPRGAGLASAFLPMLITAIIAAVLLWQGVRTIGGRLIGLILFAALAGLGEAAVLQYFFHALPGTYLANAAVLALVSAAISGVVLGLASLLGRAGIALGVLGVFVIGNPLSAINAAPELLPQPWGAIGQFFPPGAGMTLLRSVAYFDGAHAAATAWTLAAWAFAGALLLGMARLRNPVVATPSGKSVGIPPGTRTRGRASRQAEGREHGLCVRHPMAALRQDRCAFLS